MGDNMGLKVYLVGAHSTGKTTILNHISERFEVNVIKETAREIIQKYGGSLSEIRSNLDLSKKFQRDILQHQIQKEKRTDCPFVADRGLDILAYFAEYTKDLSNIIEKDYVKNYINSYKEDDVIVFFIRPHNDLIEEDGIRQDVSINDLYKMDGHIKFMFEYFDIDYISISDKHLNERVRAVETILKNNGIR